MFRTFPAGVLAILVLSFCTPAAAQRPQIARPLVAEFFESDPLGNPRLVLRGGALERLTWQDDAPAFDGDRPGSLRARYDSSLPAGLCGFPLPQVLDHKTEFSAAAVFTIDAEGFAADPDGFFQISWGLWNSQTTGLDRTGDFTNFANDSFELVEFDWFPGISPLFGGPYLAPTVFGAAAAEHPAFPFSGAFVNAGFAFDTEVRLPLDVPLLALIEHRPRLGAAVVSVHRVLAGGETLPVPGAVTYVPLDGMSLRRYQVDTVGLTLWHDGFGGPSPAVQAELVFHGIVVRPGLFVRPGHALRVPAPRRF